MRLKNALFNTSLSSTLLRRQAGQAAVDVDRRRAEKKFKNQPGVKLSMIFFLTDNWITVLSRVRQRWKSMRLFRKYRTLIS